MATMNLSPAAVQYVARRLREATDPPTPHLIVHALIHNIDFDTYMLEIRFRKIDSSTGSLTIPRSLTTSPQNVVVQLLDDGALLPDNRKAAADLVQKRLSLPAESSRAITSRGGWHNGSFVTPGKTFGPQAKFLSFVGPKAYEDDSIGMRHGTFDSWRNGMLSACAASSFLTFALGIGFAGPLLDLLNEDEGAIFNFFGTSSGGKTLATRCLHSQAGRAREADIPTYGISQRAAEELCFARRDWAVTLDEQGRVTGTPDQKREKIRSLAFMIPSGRGAIRSARVGGAHDLPNLSWRVLGVSSGEKPLEDQGTRRVAGEQLRHIDIKIPRSNEGGIFDLVGSGGDALGKETARLAGELELTIASNYGVARDQYLEQLTVNRSMVAVNARKIVDDFIECVEASTQPWERRLAKKFGIVAAGAVLAAEWDIAPFTVEHAYKCLLSVYRTARMSIFSVESEIVEVGCAIRAALREDKFPHLPKGATLPAELQNTVWGFRREDEGREIIAVLPDIFERFASSKPAAIAVIDSLIEKGSALPGSHGKRHKQILAQGFPREGRGRWVCLLASRFV